MACQSNYHYNKPFSMCPLHLSPYRHALPWAVPRCGQRLKRRRLRTLFSYRHVPSVPFGTLPASWHGVHVRTKSRRRSRGAPQLIQLSPSSDGSSRPHLTDGFFGTARMAFNSPMSEIAAVLEPRSVLIATDFSQPSEKALRHSLALARFYGSRFCLAHVVSPWV
jgi:hypothetical protein